MRKFILAGMVLSMFGWSAAGAGWDADEVAELEPKVAATIEAITEKDEGMQSLFDKAAGYAVFPKVGKGGFGIGGARGKGLLIVADETVAMVTLTQLSFGFQLGGQVYSEIIFFEDDMALGNFKRGNYELGAQASAVAIKSGVSVDAEFNEGIAIFTQAQGGLMYEASVGGQKFKIEAK